MTPPAALTYELTEHSDGLVASVAIHGAKSLNLVDGEMLAAASDGLSKLLETPDLRCLVLQGSSEQAFVGGANLNVLRALNVDTAEAFIRSISNFCAVIRHAQIPVVAKIQGYCLGAGMEIAAACDMRIADVSMLCGMPEVKVGVPSVVDAALLPGLIGWGKARELMLRGNIITANEAMAIGFAQQVAAVDALQAAVDEVTADILSAGPRAIALQKELFTAWEDSSMSAGIEAGVAAFVRAYESDEPQQKINQFFSPAKS